MNTENYKGELQEYCMAQNLGIPQYITNLVGPPNAPSWIVTVKWGTNREHTTVEPIVGTKKYAEQVAAQQALAQIRAEEARDARRQAYHMAQHRGSPLADAFTGIGVEATPAPAETEAPSEEIDRTPINVHVSLIGHAIGIANHRYNEKKRDARARFQSSVPTDSDEVFAQEIADLTMKIVRSLSAAAKRHSVTIEN
jgi:hypothetical protein